MKITGGSFGNSGSLKIDGQNGIVIKGIKAATYASGDIKDVTASTQKEKNFGCVGFIFSALILSVILGGLFSLVSLALAPVGVLVAIVVAVFGSFYTTKQEQAEITLSDGKTVNVECTAREVKRLYKLIP